MTPDLTDLLEQLAADFNRFHQEACLRIDKGNAAAGMRSRVLTLEIEKQLKVWRKASMAKPEAQPSFSPAQSCWAKTSRGQGGRV